MYLTFIEKGTPMTIELYKASEPGAASYDATFYDMASDTSFWAKCGELYNDFYSIRLADQLKVSFARFSSIYSFGARAKSIMVEGGSHLVHIEQLTGMSEIERRTDYRDELTITVRLFGLEEAEHGEKRFVKADFTPAFVGETFDISSGGLCLVSNQALESPFEPYFACDFALGTERFSLPSKLVRKGSSPQTTLFHYDYGLCFMFDGIERERTRLADAISSAKLLSIL